MPPAVCPHLDLEETDPATFFDGQNITWKRHYIGWGIAGFCAFLSTIITLRLMFKHARNYTKPAEQRHIVRIVFMIPIYSIISFFSYRYYKEALYYEVVRDCYEAFVIHSFFMLLLTYLGDDTQTQRSKITGPDRRKLMFPLGCFYYNPHDDHFLHKMKYGVLQYVFIKPVMTITAVVLEYKGLYCESVYSFAFGKVYVTIVNFTSVTIAMYCLLLFYVTIKEEIKEHSPLMKFMCVKLVIFFCFWQTCLLALLGTLGVFKATEYWSVANIQIGISALLICVEMVIFSILHLYSFSYQPYVLPNHKTSVGRALMDAFNPMDLVREVGWACKDSVLMIMGRELPVRDGHMSGTFKRANTIRAKNNSRFKNRKKNAAAAAGGATTPDSSRTAMDDVVLEEGHKDSEGADPHAQSLLLNVDGQNQYPFAQGISHEQQFSHPNAPRK